MVLQNFLYKVYNMYISRKYNIFPTVLMMYKMDISIRTMQLTVCSFFYPSLLDFQYFRHDMTSRY